MVLDIDPFHRGDFIRQSGARCAVVPATSSYARRRWRKKSPGPKGGATRPAGALRRLPDVAHRAARRACPAGQLAAMKGVNIKDHWY